MKSNYDGVWIELHETLTLALASTRSHLRLHDPDRWLTSALANDFLKSASAPSLVLTDMLRRVLPQQVQSAVPVGRRP